MFKFQFDIGTFVVLLVLVAFLKATISFPFLKRNKFSGIRVSKSFESEDIWHKIHVIAAIFTIPFDIILVVILFLEDSFAKIFLSLLVMIVVVIIYFIIPEVSTKKYFLEKSIKEKKELEILIKKETGWK